MVGGMVSYPIATPEPDVRFLPYLALQYIGGNNTQGIL